MADLLSFGEWLRKRRREMDLSRQQLADLVACAEITLRRIETDSLKPSRDLAVRLLTQVGVPTESLEMWVNYSRGVSAFPQGTLQQPGQTAKTNLRNLLTSFVGREQEIGNITQLLREHRLVSLIGMGGIGKTRLALEVGARALPAFAHGVWLAELDHITTADLLPQTLASALGLPITSAMPLRETLINFLRTKQLLLILDNCEHLLDACAQIAEDILSHCADVNILLTSRELLGITGEASYIIPSLELHSSDSIRLFVERVKLKKRDFPLDGDNLNHIIQICRRLEGIPLALELAAAQSDWFTLAEIAQILEESFELLDDGNRNAPERLRSLRASIEWSWRLLEVEERLLMQRLSVFSGDWTLESAAVICGDDPLTRSSVKRLMVQLLRKSLISVRPSATQESRYGFHDAVRQYAQEMLLLADQQEHYARQHMVYMMSFAESADAQLHGPEQRLWQIKIRNELPNLRAALAYARKHEVIHALHMASVLGEFWLRSGLLREGLGWLEDTLATSETIFSHRQSLTRENAAILQSALYSAAKLAHYMGDYARALLLEERSLNMAKRLEDPQRIANTLSLAGLTNVWRGEMEFARHSILEAIELLRGVNAQGDLASTLNQLGFLFLMQRQPAEALPLLQESLHLSRQLDDKWSLSTSLANLGSLMIQQNDLKQGQTLLEESLMIANEIQNNLVVSWVTKELAGLYMRMADYERASELYLLVLETCRVSGLLTGEAESLRTLGEISLRKGDKQEGESFLRESLTVYARLEDYSVLYCLMSFAHLATLNQDWPLALVLTSVVDHQMQLRGIQLTPDETRESEQRLDQIRTHLDIPSYERLWDRGRTIPLGLVRDALLNGQTSSLPAL